MLRRARPVPASFGAPSMATSDLCGQEPAGGAAVRVAVNGAEASPWTLALFLSTSCWGCDDLWALVSGVTGSAGRGRAVGPDVAVVAVTRLLGDQEARRAAELAGGGTVVMSDEAYAAYGVHGGPFFVVIARQCPTVVSEGVAWGAHNVVESLRRAQQAWR